MGLGEGDRDGSGVGTGLVTRMGVEVVSGGCDSGGVRVAGL